MYGWGDFSWEIFRGMLEAYQRKWRGKSTVALRDYVEMLDEVRRAVLGGVICYVALRDDVHLGGGDCLDGVWGGDSAGACRRDGAPRRRHVFDGPFMNSSDYKVAERRPIASRDLAASQRAAEWLAARGVTPNAISVAGMISGILGGLALAATGRLPHLGRVCWLLGAFLAQLRLLANMFDGMVAVRCGKASPVGELYNEVPDRVSDAAILIGLGYAAGSDVILGYVATIVAILVAYIRAMGKVAGAHQEFCGPMAKPQRMAAVTLAAVLMTILPAGSVRHLPSLALLVIIVGGAITAVRRLARIAAALRAK